MLRRRRNFVAELANRLKMKMIGEITKDERVLQEVQYEQTVPTVKDRVIQMAVKLIIEPILEVDFQDCSYGFRPGRSAHQAISRVSRYIMSGCQWVIDLDIKSYFDTIPHEELITLLRERITDKWILRLVRRWLKAGVMDGGQILYADTGTPQGGVLTPLTQSITSNLSMFCATIGAGITA